jgi:hypothetical protein
MIMPPVGALFIALIIMVMHGDLAGCFIVMMMLIRGHLLAAMHSFMHSPCRHRQRHPQSKEDKQQHIAQGGQSGAHAYFSSGANTAQQPIYRLACRIRNPIAFARSKRHIVPVGMKQPPDQAFAQVLPFL